MFCCFCFQFSLILHHGSGATPWEGFADIKPLYAIEVHSHMCLLTSLPYHWVLDFLHVRGISIWRHGPLGLVGRTSKCALHVLFLRPIYEALPCRDILRGLPKLEIMSHLLKSIIYIIILGKEIYKWKKLSFNFNLLLIKVSLEAPVPEANFNCIAFKSFFCKRYCL